MKKLMKPLMLILLLLVLTGCSATKFNDIPFSTDLDYGYSPQKPLSIYTPFEEVASKKTAEFIKGLRTAEGEKLVLADKVKVPNPNYKKPGIILYNWITGEQINQGNGRFLIKYQFQTESGRDTLNLYVNHFSRGKLQVPNSLLMARDKETELLSLAPGE